MISVSWYSGLCVISSPDCGWDLGLASKGIWQRWWDGCNYVNVIKSHTIVAPVLFGGTLSLIGFEGASGHVGKTLVCPGAEGASSWQTASCQMNAANNHVNAEVNPVPVVPQMRLLSQLTTWGIAALWDPDVEEPVKSCPYSDPQKLGENKCALFGHTRCMH